MKAIAPLFAVWDTWADNYYPGGMLIKRLALVYDELMLALDHDRRELRKQFSYFANPALLGPLPVDDDRDGSLAREAVQGHLANFRMPDFITEFKCRDDALPYDPAFTSASFSPYNYLDEIPRGRRGLRRVGLDRRRGLRQRRAVALSHACRTRTSACCWGRGITARG